MKRKRAIENSNNKYSTKNKSKIKKEQLVICACKGRGKDVVSQRDVVARWTSKRSDWLLLENRRTWDASKRKGSHNSSHYYNEEYKVGKQVVNVFGGAVQRAPHVERRSKCKKRNCSDKNVERSGCFNCNNAPIRKFFSFYPDNAHNTPTHTPHIETYFYTHARTYHFAFIWNRNNIDSSFFYIRIYSFVLSFFTNRNKMLFFYFIWSRRQFLFKYRNKTIINKRRRRGRRRPATLAAKPQYYISWKLK